MELVLGPQKHVDLGRKAKSHGKAFTLDMGSNGVKKDHGPCPQQGYEASIDVVEGLFVFLQIILGWWDADHAVVAPHTNQDSHLIIILGDTGQTKHLANGVSLSEK